MPYKDKNKQREYQRLWLQKRKKDFYKNKCCVVCGAKDKLELDHINPADKVTHRVWSMSETNRKLEVNKCQVLCKACHLEKTLRQRRERKLNASIN